MNIDWHKVHDWVDKFTDTGWRKMFFWVSAGSMCTSLVAVYILGVLAHEYPPEAFLVQLREMFLVVLSLPVLRAIEKDRIRKHEAINGT